MRALELHSPQQCAAVDSAQMGGLLLLDLAPQGVWTPRLTTLTGLVGLTLRCIPLGVRDLWLSMLAAGDGAGKWRLFITAGQSVVGVSLLESASGHLTNLSTMGAP